MTAEFCVCCGEIIPEGRQVCPNCEEKANKSKEAIKFFRVQLNRSKINLKGAQDRRDVKAEANILRKMEIYEYTLGVLHKEVKE